ncbi:hypothetical protein C8D91_1491 [Marinicella litoralis]|uniref:Uncharacterized protein n=2 Tax=Marinicella litoralis TaxID=644220 RepID=A0A4R6XRJ0_9GAMM|nr:hypothetical protein C8D91_1491 [Marinicella litoralis]
MKKYAVFSTLSFVSVFIMIELIMSNKAGFTIYAGFNWLIHVELFSWTHLLTWMLQGAALSFAAFLYMKPNESLADGFRFGLITGLLFSIVVLFNMMGKVDHNTYQFFADSLLPLTGLYILGFTISGWLFGLMFELFAPEFPTIKNLWSMV